MAADLDLRRTLRAIWNGTRNPPAGGVRDLTARILSRRNRSSPGLPWRSLGQWQA